MSSAHKAHPYVMSADAHAEKCLRHLKDLNQLPPLRPIAMLVNVDNRHQALDAMQFAAQRREEAIEQLDSLPTKVNRSTRKALLAIDWNAAMRVLNGHYDAFVTALQEPDPMKRAAYVEASRPRQRRLKTQDFVEELTQAAETGQEELSRYMGKLYFDRIAIATACDLEFRYQARRRAVRTAYAAYLYRIEKGNYPESLDLLTPMLNELPVDPFTGQALRINTIDGGIVVYSVGVNRIDDGGLSWDDGRGKDDIRVRLMATREEELDR